MNEGPLDKKRGLPMVRRENLILPRVIGFMSMIYYLVTPNNFVGSKRNDINKILIIYLVLCQL